MIVFLLITITLYTLLVSALIFGWFRLSCTKVAQKTVDHFYTVIVPVRNEEKNIPGLFKVLSTLDFPEERFEIIFINDHSEDSTVEVITRFLNQSERSIKISLLHLKTTYGKKAAVQLAVREAKGDVIVATDADCRMSPLWLKSISNYYEQDSQVEMVFGPVTFHDDDSLFERLQTIEFASLIGTGAASLALGMPNMCNGANISYKKDAFFAVGGYDGNEKLASGDDEFLMHKFHEKFPERVLFNKCKEGLVTTSPQSSCQHFFQQRKRWASKWRYYSSIQTSLLAIFILMFQLSFITAVGLLVINFDTYYPLLLPIAFKVIAEAVFLFSVMRFMSKRLHPILFIILQFTYPFYVILFGIAANFGKYRWKGRYH